MCCAYVWKFTVQLCALYFRHDVIRLSWPRSWQCVPSALNVNVKKFNKAAVNGGSNYGNQTISSTRPSCWIQVSTVDEINIAADHQMFMILIGELSWQRLRRSAVDFYSENEKNRSLSHPLGHLGVTYALHLWLVGKPVVDFIFVVIELFFAISYGWDVMSGNRSKSAFFEGGGSFWAQISEGRGHRPPTTDGVRKLDWLPFRVVSKYVRSALFSFVTIHASDGQTDGRTDRRTEFRQQYTVRCSTRMQSHGKNGVSQHWSSPRSSHLLIYCIRQVSNMAAKNVSEI